MLAFRKYLNIFGSRYIVTGHFDYIVTGQKVKILVLCSNLPIEGTTYSLVHPISFFHVYITIAHMYKHLLALI